MKKLHNEALKIFNQAIRSDRFVENDGFEEFKLGFLEGFAVGVKGVRGKKLCEYQHDNYGHSIGFNRGVLFGYENIPPIANGKIKFLNNLPYVIKNNRMDAFLSCESNNIATRGTGRNEDEAIASFIKNLYRSSATFSKKIESQFEIENQFIYRWTQNNKTHQCWITVVSTPYGYDYAQKRHKAERIFPLWFHQPNKIELDKNGKMISFCL